VNNMESILNKTNHISNQYADLVEQAREYIDESEFIMNVIEFYDERGFITEKQATGLENWIDSIEQEDYYPYDPLWD